MSMFMNLLGSEPPRVAPFRAASPPSRLVLLRAVLLLGGAVLGGRAVLRGVFRIVRVVRPAERDLEVVALRTDEVRGDAVFELEGELAPFRAVRNADGGDTRVLAGERRAIAHRA